MDALPYSTSIKKRVEARCAKLRTPSMLKMTVRPLAIRNSSIPYSTPLSVDMTISSSTTYHPWKVKTTLAPAVAGANDRLRDDQSVFSNNGCRSLHLKKRTISLAGSSGRWSAGRFALCRSSRPPSNPNRYFPRRTARRWSIRQTTLCTSAGRTGDRPSSCSPCRR